jgi:hypothetical protein
MVLMTYVLYLIWSIDGANVWDMETATKFHLEPGYTQHDTQEDAIQAARKQGLDAFTVYDATDLVVYNEYPKINWI